VFSFANEGLFKTVMSERRREAARLFSRGTALTALVNTLADLFDIISVRDQIRGREGARKKAIRTE
jgi:hypothetical protein